MKNKTQKTKMKNNKQQKNFEKEKTMLGKDLGLQCQTPLRLKTYA